jgi:hypothetical protein
MKVLRVSERMENRAGIFRIGPFLIKLSDQQFLRYQGIAAFVHVPLGLPKVVQQPFARPHLKNRRTSTVRRVKCARSTLTARRNHQERDTLVVTGIGGRSPVEITRPDEY